MKTRLQVLVEKFQCPGCVAGSSVDCGVYQEGNFGAGRMCSSHVPGTSMIGAGRLALGMPKGFCRWSATDKFETLRTPGSWPIVILLEGSPKPSFHPNFMIPVWAMVKDGFLFVRVFEPRINRTSVFIIEGGTLKDAPGAQDVSTFIDTMD